MKINKKIITNKRRKNKPVPVMATGYSRGLEGVISHIPRLCQGSTEPLGKTILVPAIFVDPKYSLVQFVFGTEYFSPKTSSQIDKKKSNEIKLENGWSGEDPVWKYPNSAFD